MRGKGPFGDLKPLIDQVYAYTAYRLGPGPEAEDVTSETFERAFRYAKSFDEQKGNAIAWLLGIARRCADDALAARRHDDDEVEEVAGPGEVHEDVARRLDLQAALALLSDEDRELVALRYGADLKARQIAELLGERTNTVEVALHRALRRLRSLLEDQGPAERPGEAGEESAVRI